jgi:Uma2 family endonuclease
MSDDEFFQLCQANAEWRIERNREGDLVVMPPANPETSNQNFGLIVAFGTWVKADGTGLGFESSAGFTLPNGAVRSPDLAWIARSRWERISPAERRKFPHICPDFVVELRSPSDSLTVLQEKMEEYIENGARLGWLIDPQEKKVYLYRPDTEVVCLENPGQVVGDPQLPGFVLDLKEVW